MNLEYGPKMIYQAVAMLTNEPRSGGARKMGRKERCPQCGSKKIIATENQKKCSVCQYEWTGKASKRTPKKDKTRFR